MAIQYLNLIYFVLAFPQCETKFYFKFTLLLSVFRFTEPFFSQVVKKGFGFFCNVVVEPRLVEKLLDRFVLKSVIWARLNADKVILNNFKN